MHSIFSGENKDFHLPKNVEPIICNKTLLTNTDVNKLTSTPIDNVLPTPAKVVAPNLCPNHIKTALVMSVEILASLMAVQALLNPISIDDKSVRPNRNSSLVLSNINILASTAIPIDNINPAKPASVKVIGINLNNVKTIAVYKIRLNAATIPAAR